MTTRRLLFVAKVASLAAVYFGAARLGLLLSFLLGHNTLVWPPTGIALAALLLFGTQLWPGITLGAFLASVATGAPLAVASGVSVGNTLEVLCAVFLLHRVVGFQNSLERLQDVLGLVGLAAGLSTMVSATIDITSFCLGGVAPWEAYGALWRVWWLGGAMSDLVIAPLILTWGAQSAMSKNPRRIAEAGILLTVLVTVCLLVFGGWSHVSLVHYSLDYAVFPLIIWAGLRFHQRAAMTAVFIVSAIAVWGTGQGFGPFARGTVPERLSLLYAFVSVTATTALVMSARRRAEETLRRLSRQLARVQDEERRRIAGELRETVGQNLSASAMLLSLVNKSTTVRDPRDRQRLAESIALTQQSTRELRTLSHLLHPPLLDEMGLGSALQWYAEGFAQRSGIKVTLEVAPELERLQG